MARENAKGKGKVIDEKKKINNKPKGDKPIDSGSNNKKRDGKKKRIKKIVLYDNDVSSSSSHKDTDDSSSKKKTVKIITLKHILIILAFHTIQMRICCLSL
jgi:hypothetical protein